MTAGTVWDETVRRLGGSPGDSGDDLDRRYAEPHRRYHTGLHASAVVRDAASLAVGVAPRERDVVTLAACAHDVVYDARPGEDERASAEWARCALTGVDETIVARVETLVLATIDHVARPGDVPAHVLLDADLAILGTERATYDAYAENVRAEYAAVSDAEWRVGRAAVLRRLLARNPLYYTAAARERWDTKARANLTSELSRY